MIDTERNVPAIEVTSVTHSFKRHQALNGVTFTVDRGSLHGFVGPNGAGKTTTLKIICTLLRHQHGRVAVFGYDVRDSIREIRRRIGYMPDHFSMYRQMTVFEYLDFFAAAYGFGMRERDQIVGDVLSLTDMDGRKDDLISGLSRGMQQRVSLARVLVNDPELLLLDEPASGLDPRARIELMDILRELKRLGKTIFISSHILSELAELCDSVTIIDRGQTKYSGPMDALLDQPTELATYRLRLAEPIENFEEAIRKTEGIHEIAWVGEPGEWRITYLPDTLDNRGLLQAVFALGGEPVRFVKDQRHLNDAFMALTERGVRS